MQLIFGYGPAIMIVSAVFAGILSLHGALASVAQSEYLICIGDGACSRATTQRCSIALGVDVQLPEGMAGDHVLATPFGSRPLRRIDDAVVARIEGAIRQYTDLWRPNFPLKFDPNYIKEWNAACAQ